MEHDDNLNAGICGVWFYYKNKTGDELESISHHEDSVWTKYYESGKNVQLNDTQEKRDMIQKRSCIAYKQAEKVLNGVSVD